MFLKHDLSWTNNHDPGISTLQADESEDKLLSRIGSMFGTLRNLGFSEEQVYECLNSIPGIDMDDALEWVGLMSKSPFFSCSLSFSYICTIQTNGLKMTIVR